MIDHMKEARDFLTAGLIAAGNSPERNSAAERANLRAANAHALIAIAEALQPALISVEDLGGRVTDMAPRDAKHRALDDPRYASRCGHKWIIAGDPQLHECFQAEGGHADIHVADIHVCTCGQERPV